MSKLFDQLKDAARSREQSPGLLLGALQRSQERDPTTAADTVAPGQAGAHSSGAPAPVAVGPVAPPQSGARSSYAGIGLAAVILTVTWLAWNAAPWRAPQRVKIDPTTLKLDRSFQIDRPSPKGTTPPAPRS